MKAPEKIYIGQATLQENVWQQERCDDIEYIRKDISDETVETAEDHAYFAGKEKLREELLEWANETLELAAHTSPVTDKDVIGYMHGIKAVIEKLKSL